MALAWQEAVAAAAVAPEPEYEDSVVTTELVGVFKDRKGMVEAVQRHASAESKRVRQDPNRKGGACVHFVCCTPSCQWHLVGVRTAIDAWTLRERIGCHTCFAQGSVSAATMASMPSFRSLANAQASAAKLQTHLLSQGLSTSIHKVYRAKQLIASQNRASYTASFARLPGYLEALRPWCHTAYEASGGNFLRAAVVFKVSPMIQSLLKITVVDAVHSKHPVYAGQMLVMTTLTSNRNLVVLAVAWVDAENSDNYSWFFRQIKEVEGLAGFVESSLQLSDRGKGLACAQRQEFPQTPVRKCGRHIVSSVRKHIKGGAGVTDANIWDIINAGSVAEYETALQVLRNKHLAAGTYVQAIENTSYVFYTFIERGIATFGSSTSNVVESRNSAYLGARFLAPMHAIEAVVRMEVKRLVSDAGSLRKREGVLTPYAHAVLQKNWEAARSHECLLLTPPDDRRGKATVRALHSQAMEDRTVHLANRTCTCKKFQDLKIPCSHACAVAMALNLSVSEIAGLCSEVYHAEPLANAYDEMRKVIEIPDSHHIRACPGAGPPARGKDKAK
eukprot:scaffold4582_cov202-Prasinococcus_capsulatus_cf.AAC.4